MAQRRNSVSGLKDFSSPESAADAAHGNEKTTGEHKHKLFSDNAVDDGGLGALKMMMMMMIRALAPPEAFAYITKSPPLLAREPPIKWWSQPIKQALSQLLISHPIPCVFALSLLFFMGVEYSLLMVSPSSPPYDLGFVLTRGLHGFLAQSPSLNNLLAALNTVFVGMQTVYILWALLIECRPRAAIAALFMFTCRGILGYSTQLPLPNEFLGSGVDFPVGNVSFFLFFSGHVGGSVIASIDMRRVQRWELAWFFDALNVLQCLRLLATRGHYTIDLAVGVAAGFLCDAVAGRYLQYKDRAGKDPLTTNRSSSAVHQLSGVQPTALGSKPLVSTF